MERLITTISNADTVLHLHRYALANEYAKGKIILDIASGEGYGTNLLSKSASLVYGVDIDKEAIIAAKNKYIKNNIKFIQGTTSKIPLNNNSIDVAVSFETIEHHDKHEEMIEEILRVLKPNGLLIISTPDKHFYSDVNKHNNEFHVKELYKPEFVNLISRYFIKYQILSQSYLNGNSLFLEEKTRVNMKFYSGNFEETKIVLSNPDFLIAIASSTDFKKQRDSIFEGSSILLKNTVSRRMVNEVYNSNSYKIGHTVLSPFKFLKKAIKVMSK